jgi:hypothetical protein
VGNRKKPREQSPPPELLWGVSWTFRDEPFTDRAAFDAAVAEFQDPDSGEVWRPDEVVLHAARVRVSPDVDWYLTEDHPTTDFTSDNGESFTAGELLFKVHNRFVTELRQMDHKYFEGLTLDEDQEPGEPPLYGLDLGS